MVTAELAVAIPALGLLLALAMTPIAVSMARLRVVDAAAVAARLVARGESAAVVEAQVRQVSPGARVTWARGGGVVRVVVRSRARLPVVGRLLPSVPVVDRLTVPDEAAVGVPDEAAAAGPDPP